MKLLEYNLNQLRRTYRKKYENYVVTRIFHRLNLPDLQFVTQQLVRRPSGIALTDLYLPQLKLHIEIDEPHHGNQTDADEIRTEDIIEATKKLDIVEANGHRIERIRVTDAEGDINKFNELIDNLIDEIKRIIEVNGYEPWYPGQEFDCSKFLQKGKISVSDNPRFRTITAAINFLGQNVSGMQKAFFRSKKYPEYNFWFPKLYPNSGWDNKLQEDGELIFEKPTNETDIRSHYQAIINDNAKRIVFPRFTDNLGAVVYRFMGIYIVDKEKSSETKGIVYRRVSTEFEL